MEEVRAQAERMVQRTEIVRQANAVAQRILDDANDEARTMRHEAEDFCDQKLAGMEIVLDRLTKTVQSGRAKLAAPLVETHTTAEEAAGTEEDGFFDQDVS
jgi:cell division septum initiation protein DivIVA